MATPTKNDIIVIAKRCIDEYDGKIVKRLDKQDATLDDQNKVLNEHSLKLNTIQNQLLEMYGNGSGRKGILDRMKETQTTQAEVVAVIQSNVAAEKREQELFRLEVRNALKIEARERSVQSSTNNKWIKALKYLAAPLAIVIWEFIKSHYHIGEK